MEGLETQVLQAKVVLVGLVEIMVEKRFLEKVVMVVNQHRQHREELRELVEKGQLMVEEIRVELVQR